VSTDPLAGYDFEAEAQALSELLSQESPSPLDPLYPRLEIYRANLQLLEQRKAEHFARASANPEVPVAEAQKVKALSQLRPDEEDTMVLHTLEAMRLYLGVSPEPGTTNKFGVPGARRAATALRQLFILTGLDNPYADWILIQTDERVERIKKLINKHRDHNIRKLDELKSKGLNYGILKAAAPQSVSLGYHSPYGYMMSTIVVMFDECVRVLKSAERRDQITKREQHEVLYEIKHAIRSMFESAMKGQRVLMDEDMRGLKRTDFAATDGSTDEAKRVLAARQIFGMVPTEIFTGQLAPRHTLRSDRITASEMRVLEGLAQTQSTESAESATAAKAAGLIE
jgi:integrating conjugative element protein (TIGR03761 family)